MDMFICCGNYVQVFKKLIVYMTCLHGIQTDAAAEDTAENQFEDYRQEHGNVASDSSENEDSDSSFNGLSSSDTSSSDGDFISV